jgi:hypothetical protein
MFNVYQPWDPLKVCVVGKSYPPEFYEFIKNSKLRDLFQRIAKETEEDFLFLEKTLQSFGVQTVRPNVPNVLVEKYMTRNQRIPGPISMTPRDQMIMIGDKFFLFPYDTISLKASGRIRDTAKRWTPEMYSKLRGANWPEEFTPFDQLPTWVQEELLEKNDRHSYTGDSPSEISARSSEVGWWKPVLDLVNAQGNTIVANSDYQFLNQIPSNGITRIGKDLYFGYTNLDLEHAGFKSLVDEFLPEYRCHFVKTEGHIDGAFSPVKPGLIVSIVEMKNFKDTFPGWEVLYLPGESWDKVKAFTDLKTKNQGRWWIKDHENDLELINFVETWLYDWVGYVEETVFDVNMLTVDQNNVLVSNYNKEVFDTFKRHNITPHICPVRHRYFWDGGIHCVTLDLHREGTMKDYFPERG